MKKMLLKIFNTFQYCKNPKQVYLVCLLFLIFPTDLVFAQNIVVTGTENNINISKIKLSIGSESFEQTSPTGNVNPSPADSPVLIESVEIGRASCRERG